MAIVYANDDQIHSIDAALLKFALKVIDKDKIQKKYVFVAMIVYAIL